MSSISFAWLSSMIGRSILLTSGFRLDLSFLGTFRSCTIISATSSACCGRSLRAFNLLSAFCKSSSRSSGCGCFNTLATRLANAGVSSSSSSVIVLRSFLSNSWKTWSAWSFGSNLRSDTCNGSCFCAPLFGRNLVLRNLTNSLTASWAFFGFLSTLRNVDNIPANSSSSLGWPPCWFRTLLAKSMASSLSNPSVARSLIRLAAISLTSSGLSKKWRNFLSSSSIASWSPPRASISLNWAMMSAKKSACRGDNSIWLSLLRM